MPPEMSAAELSASISPVSKGKVLVVDDELDIREGLDTLLSLEGYTVELAINGAEGVRKIESRAYDLVLLDLMMPDRSGMDVLRDVRQRDRETPIFMITAYGSVEAAVDALKLGANDYFSKPWDNEKLLIEIDRMISKRRLEYENTHLKRALKQRYSFPNIIGKSDRMLRLLDLVGQVASSRSTILVTGETGTGKELIAKAIHTISPHMQAKLLRVIQEKEFIPLGATEPVRVDVRILAATNDDLKKRVDEGTFREDLYYRLNVINIVLPPLRERKEDIPALVSHFFTKYCRENEKFLDDQNNSVLRFQPEVMQILMEHNWPGNVRELENAVERAVVLATDASVPLDVLPDHLLQSSGIRLRRGEGGALPADASLFEIVADFERRIILERLEQHNGSQTEAAAGLHVPLSTLNQKIKRLDIKIPKKSE